MTTPNETAQPMFPAMLAFSAGWFPQSAQERDALRDEVNRAQGLICKQLGELKEANDRAERLEREYKALRTQADGLACEIARLEEEVSHHKGMRELGWSHKECPVCGNEFAAALAALPADREPVATPNLTAIEIASPFNACIHKGFCLSLIRRDASPSDRTQEGKL